MVHVGSGSVYGSWKTVGVGDSSVSIEVTVMVLYGSRSLAFPSHRVVIGTSVMVDVVMCSDVVTSFSKYDCSYASEASL
jgi:hypothetical protein